MKNYMYELTIQERGYADVPRLNYTGNERSKEAFVIHHLAPTLRASNCGWRIAQYRIMETPSGHRTEFLVLWVDDIDNSGSRWINVTGDSLGAIMCAMCDNLW